MKKRKQRVIQRERKIQHGNYMTVHVFPVFAKPKGRKKKCKPSTAIQAALNQKYREERLRYLLDTNFTRKDIEVGLGYDDAHLPENYEQCKRDVVNFHRRLNRFRTAIGLSEMKYIYCIERGRKNGRWHVHDTMSGGTIDASDETIKKIKPFFRGMSADDIRAAIERGGYKQCVKMIWGRGYAHTYDLEFNSDGLQGLAKYKIKPPETENEQIDGKIRRWSTSKNLKQPQITERDNYISKSTVRDIRRGDVSEREIERLYPGYTVTEYSAVHNCINAGEYLTIRLYKRPGGERRNNREKHKKR